MIVGSGWDYGTHITGGARYQLWASSLAHYKPRKRKKKREEPRIA